MKLLTAAELIAMEEGMFESITQTQKRIKKKKREVSREDKIKSFKRLSMIRHELESCRTLEEEKILKEEDKKVKTEIYEFSKKTIDKVKKYCIKRLGPAARRRMGDDKIDGCIAAGFSMAVNKFDIYNINASKFSTFMTWYAWGAIIDEIRRDSMTPQSVYSNNKKASDEIESKEKKTRCGITEGQKEEILQRSRIERMIVVINECDMSINREDDSSVLDNIDVPINEERKAVTNELDLESIIKDQKVLEVISMYYVTGIKEMEVIALSLEIPISTAYRRKSLGEKAIRDHFGSKNIMKRFIYRSSR